MADKDATEGAPQQPATKEQKGQAEPPKTGGKTTEDVVREQGADSSDEPES